MTLRFAAVMFLVAVFGASPPSGQERREADLVSTLEEMVPDGWTMYEGVSSFTPDNLYEQINGRATFYLSYDVASMVFAGYEDPADPGLFIDVSVFDMRTPVNAFGVFSSQRPSGASNTEYGRRSCEADGHRYLWKGQYYVQIVVSTDSDEMRLLADKMASTLDQALPEAGDSVWGLENLPEEHLIADSERYYRAAALGLDFLTQTYVADYNYDGVTATAFLSSTDSSEEATEMLRRFEQHSDMYGNNVEKVERDGVSMLVADMGGQFDLFLAEDSLVMGIYGAENREQAIGAALRFYGDLSESRR